MVPATIRNPLSPEDLAAGEKARNTPGVSVTGDSLAQAATLFSKFVGTSGSLANNKQNIAKLSTFLATNNASKFEKAIVERYFGGAIEMQPAIDGPKEWTGKAYSEKLTAELNANPGTGVGVPFKPVY